MAGPLKTNFFCGFPNLYQMLVTRVEGLQRKARKTQMLRLATSDLRSGLAAALWALEAAADQSFAVETV